MIGLLKVSYKKTCFL